MNKKPLTPQDLPTWEVSIPRRATEADLLEVPEAHREGSAWVVEAEFEEAENAPKKTKLPKPARVKVWEDTPSLALMQIGRCIYRSSTKCRIPHFNVKELFTTDDLLQLLLS